MSAPSIWTVADLTVPAVDVADMRQHLREDYTDQDAVIDAVLRAATRAVEMFTQRILVRRAAVLRCQTLPCGRDGLRLPGGAVGTVTAMTVEGQAFTAFEVIGTSPAMMIPDADWPVVTQEGYPVSVSYTVGPVTPSPDLKAAVKLIAAELYERRSDASELSLSEVPVSARMLMQPHRILPR